MKPFFTDIIAPITLVYIILIVIGGMIKTRMFTDRQETARFVRYVPLAFLLTVVMALCSYHFCNTFDETWMFSYDVVSWTISTNIISFAAMTVSAFAMIVFAWLYFFENEKFVDEKTAAK